VRTLVVHAGGSLQSSGRTKDKVIGAVESSKGGIIDEGLGAITDAGQDSRGSSSWGVMSS
jgi:hypothetical protein